MINSQFNRNFAAHSTSTKPPVEAQDSEAESLDKGESELLKPSQQPDYDPFNYRKYHGQQSIVLNASTDNNGDYESGYAQMDHHTESAKEQPACNTDCESDNSSSSSENSDQDDMAQQGVVVEDDLIADMWAAFGTSNEHNTENASDETLVHTSSHDEKASEYGETLSQDERSVDNTAEKMLSAAGVGTEEIMFGSPSQRFTSEEPTNIEYTQKEPNVITLGALGTERRTKNKSDSQKQAEKARVAQGHKSQIDLDYSQHKMIKEEEKAQTQPKKENVSTEYARSPGESNTGGSNLSDDNGIASEQREPSNDATYIPEVTESPRKKKQELLGEATSKLTPDSEDIKPDFFDGNPIVGQYSYVVVFKSTKVPAEMTYAQFNYQGSWVEHKAGEKKLKMDGQESKKSWEMGGAHLTENYLRKSATAKLIKWRDSPGLSDYGEETRSKLRGRGHITLDMGPPNGPVGDAACFAGSIATLRKRLQSLPKWLPKADFLLKLAVPNELFIENSVAVTSFWDYWNEVRTLLRAFPDRFKVEITDAGITEARLSDWYKKIEAVTIQASEAIRKNFEEQRGDYAFTGSGNQEKNQSAGDEIVGSKAKLPTSSVTSAMLEATKANAETTIKSGKSLVEDLTYFQEHGRLPTEGQDAGVDVEGARVPVTTRSTASAKQIPLGPIATKLGIWIPDTIEKASRAIRRYETRSQEFLLKEMHKRRLPTKEFRSKLERAAVIAADDDGKFWPAYNHEKAKEIKASEAIAAMTSRNSGIGSSQYHSQDNGTRVGLLASTATKYSHSALDMELASTAVSDLSPLSPSDPSMFPYGKSVNLPRTAWYQPEPQPQEVPTIDNQFSIHPQSSVISPAFQSNHRPLSSRKDGFQSVSNRQYGPQVERKPVTGGSAVQTTMQTSLNHTLASGYNTQGKHLIGRPEVPSRRALLHTNLAAPSLDFAFASQKLGGKKRVRAEYDIAEIENYTNDRVYKRHAGERNGIHSLDTTAKPIIRQVVEQRGLPTSNLGKHYRDAFLDTFEKPAKKSILSITDAKSATPRQFLKPQSRYALNDRVDLSNKEFNNGRPEKTYLGTLPQFEGAKDEARPIEPNNRDYNKRLDITQGLWVPYIPGYDGITKVPVARAVSAKQKFRRDVAHAIKNPPNFAEEQYLQSLEKGSIYPPIYHAGPTDLSLVPPE